MMSEQGPGFLADWGGPSAYIYWSKRPEAERLVYFAVEGGHTTVQDIADVTGLPRGEVSKSLTTLESQGTVEAGVVTA
jgi:CRP-like cAMP-binding protein